MKHIFTTIYYVVFSILSVISNVLVFTAALIFLLLLAVVAVPVATLWIVLEIFKLIKRN